MSGSSPAVSATGPSRWRLRRWLIPALVLLCTLGLQAVREHLRAVRAERLAAEIKRAGGQALFPYPAWERLRQRIRGERWYPYEGIHVELPPNIDPQWLKERDYLADLSIEELFVEEAPDLSPALPILVSRHPLKKLFLWKNHSTGTDRIAAALSDNRELSELALQNSDLTDAGLQRLPLERIEELALSGTQVTAEGLRELRRARRLHLLLLDGRQVSPDIMSLLEQKLESYVLILVGPDVTDATLEPLIAELDRHPAPKLLRVWLSDETSVSDSGIHAWRRALPSIKIQPRP